MVKKPHPGEWEVWKDHPFTGRIPSNLQVKKYGSEVVIRDPVNQKHIYLAFEDADLIAPNIDRIISQRLIVLETLVEVSRRQTECIKGRFLDWCRGFVPHSSKAKA